MLRLKPRFVDKLEIDLKAGVWDEKHGIRWSAGSPKAIPKIDVVQHPAQVALAGKAGIDGKVALRPPATRSAANSRQPK